MMRNGPSSTASQPTRHACMHAGPSTLVSARTVPVRLKTPRVPRSSPLAQKDGVLDAPEARGEPGVLPAEVEAPARVARRVGEAVGSVRAIDSGLPFAGRGRRRIAMRGKGEDRAAGAQNTRAWTDYSPAVRHEVAEEEDRPHGHLARHPVGLFAAVHAQAAAGVVHVHLHVPVSRAVWWMGSFFCFIDVMF